MRFLDSCAGPGDGTLQYEVYNMHGLCIPLPDGWALEHAEIEQRWDEPLRMELRLLCVDEQAGTMQAFDQHVAARCTPGVRLGSGYCNEIRYSNGT